MTDATFDESVQDTFPVAIAPHEGPMPCASKAGIRNILAAGGILREIATFWMVRRKLHGACNLPYGALAESLEFLVAAPPVQLWSDFLEVAKLALPNECAALMVWNHTLQQWRLEVRHATHASRARIDYLEPSLAEDDVVVVDIHSHGQYGAFFSKLDDQDDAGGIKVSAVIGKVDQTTSEFVIRLVAIDEFIPLVLNSGGKFQERLQ